MTRLPALVLALLAATLVACGDPTAQQRAEDLLAEQGGAHGHGNKPTTERPAPKPSEQMTVEQLGTKLGCTPKPDVKAADYHRATCTTDLGSVLLLDFVTPQAQDQWLDIALDYGNTYLVGEQWILGVPEPEDLNTLQDKFGGAIEGGD